MTKLTTSPERPEMEKPPLVQSLKGSLRGSGLDREDYRRHLEEKHH